MNIFGKYHSNEKIGQSQHNVRLLQFQPGKIFKDVLKTNHLYYQVGEYLAMLDNAMKNFEHDGLKHRATVWHLEQLPKINEFLGAVTELDKRAIVEEVIDAFNSQVLQHLHKFQRGVIHGDFNEHNILVTKTDRPMEYKVSGVIDFGDMSYSCYIFELAIAIAYVLLQSEDLDAGGYVIAGYSTRRNISKYEMDALKVNLYTNHISIPPEYSLYL